MLLLFVTTTAAVVAGCWPDGEPRPVFDERFEDCVECRWTVAYGGFEVVQTIHPAEHGLRFVAATEMSAALAVTIYDQFSDGMWLEYSTSCGGTPEISAAPGVSGWEVRVRLPTAGDGSPGEFQRVHANLPPIGQQDEWGTYPDVTLSRLIVSADPYEGGCVFDNLRLMVAEPDYGY